MTTNHLDAAEVDSYDYLIVGGGTAVSNIPFTPVAPICDGT